MCIRDRFWSYYIYFLLLWSCSSFCVLYSTSLLSVCLVFVPDTVPSAGHCFLFVFVSSGRLLSIALHTCLLLGPFGWTLVFVFVTSGRLLPIALHTCLLLCDSSAPCFFHVLGLSTSIGVLFFQFRPALSALSQSAIDHFFSSLRSHIRSPASNIDAWISLV